MNSRLPPLLAAFLSLAALGAFGGTPPAVLAAETPTYIAIGDSLAFGVGASSPSSGGYVALAFDALRKSERYGERGLELVNLSVPGATSEDLLLEGGQVDKALKEIAARTEDESSLDDNVEVISIDIGGNDLLRLARADSPCLTEASAEPCLDLFGQVLSALQDNLTGALERLRAAAPAATIVVIDLYNPYSGTGDFREAIADLGVGQINGVIGAVAADADLEVRPASVYQHFQGRGKQWIAPDGLHPNDAGHSVLAEALVAAVEDRSVVIPEALLLIPPGPAGGSEEGPLPQISSRDDDSFVLLLIAVPAAFAAGMLVAVAYFMARGRPA